MKRARACASTLLVVCSATACAPEFDDVYLFDCGGNVGILDGNELTVGRAVHVSAVDSTLPGRVRDGCAISRGWYVSGAERLFLQVQIQAAADATDLLPTRTIVLSVPDLRPAERTEHTPIPERRSDSRALLRRIPLVRSPFASSAAYYVYGEATLLLQELEPGTADAGVIWPVTVRIPGAVELGQAIAGATGRYALYDLATDTQLGDVIAVVGGSDDDRVLCTTPDGLFVLAAARDSLLVVDTKGGRGSVVSRTPELDLYWTACAWNDRGMRLTP